MVEAVDPAAAAPAGHGSEYSDALSTATDVTYDADTPLDLMDIATEDMDLSPGRKVAYRVGSVKTTVDERFSATR
eukprot:6866697-Pyramimonas_sp.AAC.1